MFFCSCNKKLGEHEKSIKDIKDVLKVFIPDNSSQHSATTDLISNNRKQIQNYALETSRAISDLQKQIDEVKKKMRELMTREAVHSLMQGYTENTKKQVELVVIQVNKLKEAMTLHRDNTWIAQESWNEWRNTQENKYTTFAKQWTLWSQQFEKNFKKKRS